jgi:predicted DNA-binding protein (MmcQ/YjbR family)
MGTDEIRPDWLAEIRRIALSRPEATEKETWGHPTFRVKDKIFAGIGVGDAASDRRPDDANDWQPTNTNSITALTMKAAAGEQESLLAIGYPYFRPKYVGNRGWIGIVIDDNTDWSEVEELVIDSYRAIAPKKLVNLLDKPRQ